VHLAVYDLLGRRVRLIAEGALEPGAHDWDWRGTNDAGTRVHAGLYHVRAVVDGVAATRSVVRIY
jgi:flagellar hook assembly protein FlgD